MTTTAPILLVLQAQDGLDHNDNDDNDRNDCDKLKTMDPRDAEEEEEDEEEGDAWSSDNDEAGLLLSTNNSPSSHLDQPRTTPSRPNALAASPLLSSSPFAMILPQQRLLPNHNSSTTITANYSSKWYALLFSNVVALLAASTNASSFTLSYHYGVHTQLFQMFWMYCLLALELTRKRPPPSSSPDTDATCHVLPGTQLKLHIPFYVYIGMSFLDILPGFLTLLSFRYSAQSLMTTTLLGSSLTVPSTMLFARQLLARTFQRHHYLGVLFCVLGGCVAIYADVTFSSARNPSNGTNYNGNTTVRLDLIDNATDSSSSSSSTAYIADLLAISAAILFGLGDVVAEFAVKHVDKHEFLGMIGLLGALFCFMTFPLVDGPALLHVWQTNDGTTLGYIFAVLIWYIVSVYAYYHAIAAFLQTFDATLLNLSMQASTLWAMLCSVVAYHIVPPPLFYLAVTMVVAGVLVYETTTTSTTARNTRTVPDTSESTAAPFANTGALHDITEDS